MRRFITYFFDKILFFLSLAVFITACAHERYYEMAGTAFNTGDYDGAVYNSVEALKSKPDYIEALMLLRNAIKPAYDYHLSAAKAYESKQEFDRAVAEYKSIERLIEAVSSVRKDIILDDVSKIKRQSSHKAAEAHYSRGKALLEEGEKTRNRSRLLEAAIEFRKAQEFMPGYKQSSSLYERAREGGVTRVAVLPFVHLNAFTDYGDALADQIIAAGMRKDAEFIDFITREHLRRVEGEQIMSSAGLLDPRSAAGIGKVLGVHYIVTGKIISAIVDGPKRTDAKGSDRCQVKEKKDRYRDGNVYWATHELKATAVVHVSFQLIDIKTGQIITADTVRPEQTDVAKWQEFKGDEDCLPSEVRHFSNGKTNIDSGTVLLGTAFEKASDEIAEKVFGKLN